MSVSCTISEVYRDIDQKSPIWTYLTSIWRPRWGWSCWYFVDIFGIRQLDSIWAMELFAWSYLLSTIYPIYSITGCAVYSRFGTIPACVGRTDGRTQDDSIYGASIASHGKNASCDPDHAPVGWFVILILEIDIVYLHTKFNR